MTALQQYILRDFADTDYAIRQRVDHVCFQKLPTTMLRVDQAASERVAPEGGDELVREALRI